LARLTPVEPDYLAIPPDFKVTVVERLVKANNSSELAVHALG
jgi:hypothetical protein